MRPVLYVLTFICVMALAFWAYRENYATQQALKDTAALQDEIAALREALTLQRAEWAYLNRPERLRQLATLNFDRLELLPLLPEQLGAARDIAYPPQVPMLGPITNPVDVTGEVAPDGDFP